MNSEPPPGQRGLLAIDAGVRCGIAYFGGDGRLRWYRSTNFGSVGRMRRGLRTVMRAADPLTHVVVEGGGAVADPWLREATRQALEVVQTQAEVWRADLLLARAQRSGADAKAAADTLAREIIAGSSAPAPTSLRHDAAEAVCAGWWLVSQLGWVSS